MRYLAGLIVAFSALSLGLPAAGPPASITYIANEGFLIEVGDRTILIDAIFDDRTIAYAHVPDEQTLSLMQTSEAPFDDVDLVLVTHAHRDHFSVAPMVERLTTNASVVLIGPPPVAKTLRIFAEEFENFDSTVRDVDLDFFESADLEIEGIKVRATRLHHSVYMEKDEATGEQFNRHQGVENLIYLIDVGGFKMLHVGDAVLSQNLEYFKEGAFQEQKIDVVFLEYFDWSDETKAILDRWMKPRSVIFMHLPPDAEKIHQIEAHLLQKFPNAVIFEKPMEERAF